MISIGLMLVTAGTLLFFSRTRREQHTPFLEGISKYKCGRGRGRKARMCTLAHVLCLSLSEPIHSLSVIFVARKCLSWLESLDAFVLVLCFDPIHLFDRVALVERF